MIRIVVAAPVLVLSDLLGVGSALTLNIGRRIAGARK